MEQLLEIMKKSLIQSLMEKRWFDRKTENRACIEIQDYYQEKHGNGFLTLIILKMDFNDSPGKLYYLPVYLENLANTDYSCGEGEYLAEVDGHRWLVREIDYTADYDRVSLLLLEKQTIPMRHGGKIVFGSMETFSKSVQIANTKPLHKNTSTNCVNYQTVNGEEVVHKIYKQLHEDNHEIAIFQKIQNRPFNVPRIFGYYIYESSSGIKYPLGIMVEYCEGNTIDVLLNQNIRSLWEKAALFMSRDKVQVLEIIETHLDKVRPIIIQFGKEILIFQINMNQILNEDHRVREFNYQGYLSDLKTKANFILEQVNREENQHPLIKKNIAEALTKILRREEEKIDRHDYLCGFPHGDLHLSNIICRQYEPLQLKIIDFGTKKLRLEENQNRNQTVFEDIGWIVRSLEYFIYDEVNREISYKFHLAEEEISRYRFHWNILEQTQDSSFYDMVRWMEWIGDTWKKSITKMIMQGYFASQEAYRYILSDPTNLCRDKLDNIWEKIYLGVLMSQLEYNYNFKRDYYKQFDFYYLWKFMTGRKESPLAD